MKTRLIFLGLILVAVLIWLFRPPKQADNAVLLKPTLTPVGSLITSNSPSVLQSNHDQYPTSAAFQQMKPEIENRRQAIAEKTESEWRTPIQFYGRVVDESNNAVSGATVDYSCNDTSPTGTSYYHTVSDVNGGFFFSGIQGKLLEVDVSKKSYYSYDPHGQFFNYAGENHNFVPNAGNPVVFRLHTKGQGAELIKSDFPSFAHVAQLKHDGTAIGLDLIEGRQVADNNGQLKLQYWRDLSEKNSRIFNWKLQLTIAAGGFIGTDEDFPFAAPDNGYQSPVVFDMPTNNPDWKGDVKTNYYFQLRDGRYGRMSLEFLPWNGVFTIHSLINPTGARNLEPLQ